MSDSNDNDITDDTGDLFAQIDAVTAHTIAAFDKFVPWEVREHADEGVQVAVRYGYLLALSACAKLRGDEQTTFALGVVRRLLSGVKDYSADFDGFVKFMAELLGEMSKSSGASDRLN